MKTNQPTQTICPFPKPFLRETRIWRGDGSELILGNRTKGDVINLSTGEIRVARIADRVRLDTSSATLVVGRGIFADASYRLDRLYRLPNGACFVFGMEWNEGVGMVDSELLTLLDHDHVMPIAQMLVDARDALAFLRDWYGGGWLPRDEPLVRRWAAQVLRADEYETLFGTSATNVFGPIWFVPTDA